MERSDEIKELVVALAKAQLQFDAVLKESENPAFRGSKYADLATIIKATRPALNANELVLIQTAECELDTQVTVIESTLMHSSGQWMSTKLFVPATMRDHFDAQSMGSSQTYGRRYAMQALLGVAGDVDDDGNAATGRGSTEQAQAVAREKIAAAEARRGTQAVSQPPSPVPAATRSQGGTVPQQMASTGDLAPALQASIDKLKPRPEYDPFATPIDDRHKITKVERGKGKGAEWMFISYDGEDDICVFDKDLHPFLKVGVPADFDLATTTVIKNGKKEKKTNISAVHSIGDTKFHMGKPVINVDRPAGVVFAEQVAANMPAGDDFSFGGMDA